MNKQKGEEDRLKRLIICKLCNETLEDPIILPCGETICSKHLLNETNIFKCGLCDNLHDKTSDKFPFNQTVNKLVQICDDYVDLNFVELGPEYKLAKEQCEHLKELLDESKLLIKDPKFYINDYLGKLKNDIDLSKEQLIQKIEHKYEQLINELKEIETKCILEAESKQFIRLEETIKEDNKKLMEWLILLKTNLNRGSCCAEISKESN